MSNLTISSVSSSSPFARNFPLSVEVDGQSSVADVKAAIAEKLPKFHPARQRLIVKIKSEKKALGDETTLATVLGPDLQDGEIQVKDLGPQISWKTVFLVEYFGPLVIHPLVFFFPRLWYTKDVQHSALQKYVYVFVMLHFVKRELETIFVHRFSNGTMPLTNIFKNSAHYHVFGGLFLALDVYRAKFSATSPYITNTCRDDEMFLWVCAGLWALAEISNLHTHLTLRALRPPNTRVRAIPYGFGFTYVSCPNYLFEILGWVTISVMTGSVAAWTFTLLGALTMAMWALKKHRNYQKEFGVQYPKARKALIPFIL